MQHQPTAYIRAETNEIHDTLALFGQNRDTQIMVGQILPRLFLYGPKAKNVFYIFKGLLKEKKVCNRNHMWLAKPKIFAIWPCKKFGQSPH